MGCIRINSRDWNLLVSQRARKYLSFHERRSLVAFSTGGPFPNHINPVHNLIVYFFQIRFNIILPSTTRSSKWLLPSGYPTQILYAFLISRTPQSLIFGNSNDNCGGVEIGKILIMQSHHEWKWTQFFLY
jgi:hypothetical protein